MKKTILLSSILAVGAAFADGQAAKTVDSTEVAVMCVTMPTSASLIAVPFAGYTDSAITVADMISTAELGANSKLYVPNASGTYDVWVLSAEKEWARTAANVSIGANGAVSQGESPDAAAVTSARGSAFWLEPVSSGSTGFAYLLGRSDAMDGKSSVVAGKWNLIGNTSDKNKTLGNEFVSGEKVCVPNADGGLDTYTFRNGWLKGRNSATVTILPGQGFWFLSKGTTTINW